MKLVISNYAAAKLRKIGYYISHKLKKTIAAKNTLSKIKAAYSKLRDNPYIGVPLNTKTERETKLRFLVSGSYVIIYDVCGDLVKIVNIFNGRQNEWYLFFNDNDEEE